MSFCKICQGSSRGSGGLPGSVALETEDKR